MDDQTGSVQVRANTIAVQVAHRMHVSDFQLVITSDGDARPAAAYVTPTVKRITMSVDAVLPLTDDELAGVLAHEMGHLAVRSPLALRLRDRVPMPTISAITGGLGGVVVGLLYPQQAGAVPLWLWLPLAAVLGGIVGFLADDIASAWLLRRLELRCDIERAHAFGTIGLTSFRFDPAAHLTPLERLSSSHPRPTTRIGRIYQHALRQECRCPS